MFGLIIGDKIKFVDMDLWIEVEKDYIVYGEECKFGGGEWLVVCFWIFELIFGIGKVFWDGGG